MQTQKNIIKLKAERVWRTYLGGAELDRWHGQVNEAKDGEYPEEWFASITMSINKDGESSTEGLASLVDESTTLKALIETNPELYLGKSHVNKYGAIFGILTKAIDSLTRLGVQVHPSKADAAKLLNSPFGKTEAWYIIGGRTVDGQRPHVYLGFKEGVTKSQLQELFEKQDYDGMLNCFHRIEVNPGDVFIIHGGIPHAIGKGCFLIELQEPTDYTFRLEKIAPSGIELSEEFMSHGLGFNKMFDCFNYETYSLEETLERWKLKPQLCTIEGAEIITLIDRAKTELFGMTQVNAKKRCTVNLNDTFAIAIMLEGDGWLCKGDEKILLSQGETAFLPVYSKDIEIEPANGEEAKLILCFPPVC